MKGKGFAILAGLILLAAGFGDARAADDPAKPAVPTARVNLFNGKDLTGWTFFMDAGPTNTWSIRDGVIHCSGKPNGYLRTEKDFRDYKLTVEWRFVKVAPNADNTGVMAHIQLPDRLWPQCVQCQGRHDKQGDLILMNGAESKEHKGMDANTPVPKRGPSNENPAGEWNLCEMVCDGNSVKAYINGKLMNEITECTVTAGRIGIQCEGAELEIRKVFLEPLKSSPSTGK